jgi:hypothetical protein
MADFSVPAQDRGRRCGDVRSVGATTLGREAGDTPGQGRCGAARTTGEAAAAEAEGVNSELDLDELARFVVAAVDGLIVQFEVHHDEERSQRDLGNVIRAATLLSSPSTS